MADYFPPTSMGEYPMDEELGFVTMMPCPCCGARKDEMCDATHHDCEECERRLGINGDEEDDRDDKDC